MIMLTKLADSSYLFLPIVVLLTISLHFLQLSFNMFISEKQKTPLLISYIQGQRNQDGCFHCI